MQLRRAQIPAIIWTSAIISTCLLPASSFSYFSLESALQLDKLAHILMYVGYVILWFLSATSWSKKQATFVCLTGVFLGIIIEVLQGSMRMGRAFDIADMAANAIGSIIGILLIPMIQKNLPLLKKYLPFMDKLYR